MIILWITLAIALGAAVGFVAIGAVRDRDGMAMAGASIGIIAIVIGLIAGFMTFLPKYNLWKAEIDRQVIVVEARERADAAVEDARAEVARATGTAEANEIVADSINEQYLRYLYILNLGNTDNQVIYLPTEAGLPILEAQRLAEGGRP